jgi:bacillolysin
MRVPWPLAVLLALPSAGAADLREATSLRATTASEARAWGARIDALAAGGELALARDQDDPDFPARRHLRYEQRAGGRRVFGAELARQVDGRGETLTVFGRLFDGVAGEAAPTVAGPDAARHAEVEMGPLARAQDEPELLYLPLADRTALAWMLHVRVDQRLERFFVDAASGETVLRYDDLPTTAAVGPGTGVWGDAKKVSADARGPGFYADDKLRPAALATFDLRFDGGLAGFALATGILDPAWIAFTSDNHWKDGAVVDAHVYAGYTYDYYFKRLGRRGIDGHDMPMRAVVHFLPRAAGYANAFWDSSHGAVYFGDGDALYNSFSAALDVVAHELTHGVTQFTWNGNYFGESGALNEAFSDVMGTAVEFYRQPAGTARLQADYYLGEDLAFQFNPPVNAVRSMANPGQFCFSPAIGCDADNVSRAYRGSLDNGGIHHNSGIVNQAFYLLVEGGVNRTSGRSAPGLGAANREKAEKIFYRGFTSYLTPSATFSDARAATVQAARELYGPTSGEAAAAAAAWNAVGVE